jgi:hypothetical protein
MRILKNLVFRCTLNSELSVFVKSLNADDVEIETKTQDCHTFLSNMPSWLTINKLIPRIFKLPYRPYLVHFFDHASFTSDQSDSKAFSNVVELFQSQWSKKRTQKAKDVQTDLQYLIKLCTDESGKYKETGLVKPILWIMACMNFISNDAILDQYLNDDVKEYESVRLSAPLFWLQNRYKAIDAFYLFIIYLYKKQKITNDGMLSIQKQLAKIEYENRSSFFSLNIIDSIFL